MAKKENSVRGRFNFFNELKSETVRAIYMVSFFLCAVFLVLSSIGNASSKTDVAGPVGFYVYKILWTLFGYGYFLLPVICIMLGFSLLKKSEQKLTAAKIIGAFLFFLSGMGMISILWRDTGHSNGGAGGIVGNLVARPLVSLFDTYVSLIILLALFVISLFIIFDTGIALEHFAFWKLFRKKKQETLDGVKIIDGDEKTQIKKNSDGSRELREATSGSEKDIKLNQKNSGRKKDEDDFEPTQTRNIQRAFFPPPLELLETDRGKPGVGDIKANANIIKRTLQNFGIDVEMDEISIGPSVTRYALKPAEGVKLSKIVALQNDLSLALAAHPIRIEAPIPGKSLVGIEIPNTTKTTVGLGTLLSSQDYQMSDIPLLVAIGKGVSGKSHFADINKMPHLLIAGATGAGKSVTIHALITSLLYRNSPESMKFILIDPKRVELTLYNKIPHLLTPVVTDSKKAILSLKWAAKEMDRRYDVLESHSVRDIASYHKNILAPALKKQKPDGEDTGRTGIPETMPYIIIIIDELADIMSAYPRELEAAIVRLAQMSRAVGIHLILSTQRPSVNVITGLIKANIPSRIALQVASQVDSRTILDMSGAEKLLGAGDMLYMSAEMSKPQRIQSPFISETEVKKVVSFIVKQHEDDVPHSINFSEPDKNNMFEARFGNDGYDDEDDLYDEAQQTILEAGKASTSYLQRKLRIGYARAARLIDMLEERGVISAGEGAKPRQVMGASPESETETAPIDETLV